MEAAGSQVPPPPPETPSAVDGRAGGGWRVLAVILGLALIFVGLVFVAAMVDILDTPVGEAACRAERGCTEYYDGTSGERIVNVILGFGTACLALIAGISAFVFAARGRSAESLLWLTGGAIVLGAATLGFGAI